MAPTSQLSKIVIMLKTCLRAIISLIVIFWLCQSTNAVKLQNRIVNGLPTTIEAAPFLVNLKYNGDFFCGGALISPNHVLTAAHCVKDKRRSGITVHAGTTDRRQDGILRTILVAWVPQVFTMENKMRDVAVLKLSSPISDTNTQTIGLCNSQMTPGTVLQVYGWGKTNENSKKSPNNLRTVSVPIIKKRKCQRQYRNYLHLTRSMFCAAVPGLKDSCTGDSGGPAVLNGRVCGIVSFGVGCARREYAGVYTSVPAVRDFIDKALLL